MPTSCAKCRFAVDGWCYAYGRPNIGALAINERTNYCPLVPVPKHGWLIDADALTIELMDRGFDQIQLDDLSEIQQAIADAPTIIEAEDEDGEDEL